MDAAHAVDFSVGEREVIYSTKQRKAKKLQTWPDGSLGVVANGSGGYEFYGANGRARVKTIGSLDDPARSKSSVTITGVPKKKYDYLSGGPVYVDPDTGARLMIYHAEKHGKSAEEFSQHVGTCRIDRSQRRSVSRSGNNSRTTPAKGTCGSRRWHVRHCRLASARLFPRFVRRRRQQRVGRRAGTDCRSYFQRPQRRGTAFTKYYDGSWSQPGLGGMSSPLEVGNPWNAWAAISHNDYLNQLVMVSAQATWTQPDLYLATSSDGLNWSPRQPLALDPGEQFYPTLVGIGSRSDAHRPVVLCLLHR